MSYLQTLVPYIHRNPVEAGLCSDLNDWPYSSYKNVTESTPTFLKTNEVLKWFGTADAYAGVHKKP